MTVHMNLVKYAGDFWVTLADYTHTRSVEKYSDHASVKSAIRTAVVREGADKYIAFRGEAQIKGIIRENKDNDMFYPEDFQGHTRAALIHWSMLDTLNKRFKVEKGKEQAFARFMEEAEEYMETLATPTEESTGLFDNRSAMLKSLRQDLSLLDKEIEVKMNNREKILQAINALEGLDLENLQ